MLRLSKARLALVVAPVIVLAVVGAGIAAWSTNGSGTAYAKAATAGAVTLSDAGASTTGDLYPGKRRAEGKGDEPEHLRGADHGRDGERIDHE